VDEGFGTFDHTGDLGLEVRARTLERLFELAALGLMAQIAEPRVKEPGSAVEAAVEVASEDRESLLVDWLNAVLLESELRQAIWTLVEIAGVDDRSIRARLLGVPRDRARLTFLREVKAVSHHAAEVRSSPGGLVARVVLDI
jgi:SHS2 domain-containing protein